MRIDLEAIKKKNPKLFMKIAFMANPFMVKAYVSKSTIMVYENMVEVHYPFYNSLIKTITTITREGDVHVYNINKNISDELYLYHTCNQNAIQKLLSPYEIT